MTPAEKGEEKLKLLYSLLLDLHSPGLSDTMKETGSFDSAFNWWLDQQIKKASKTVEDLDETVDTWDQHAATMDLYKTLLGGETCTESSIIPTTSKEEQD